MPEVRLVDEKGEQLGVLPTSEAIELAEQRGLDLVEVAPSAKPPVCRILDYGRFRYQVTRREREARRDNKVKSSNDLKEVRLKTRIGYLKRKCRTRPMKRWIDGGAKVKV